MLENSSIVSNEAFVKEGNFTLFLCCCWPSQLLRFLKSLICIKRMLSLCAEHYTRAILRSLQQLSTVLEDLVVPQILHNILNQSLLLWVGIEKWKLSVGIIWLWRMQRWSWHTDGDRKKLLALLLQHVLGMRYTAWLHGDCLSKVFVHFWPI